jgi:hypothetical protein
MPYVVVEPVEDDPPDDAIGVQRHVDQSDTIGCLNKDLDWSGVPVVLIPLALLMLYEASQDNRTGSFQTLRQHLVATGIGSGVGPGYVHTDDGRTTNGDTVYQACVLRTRPGTDILVENGETLVVDGDDDDRRVSGTFATYSKAKIIDRQL